MRTLLANAVTPTIPMGLFAIADALESAGHPTRIVHREIERAIDPNWQLGRLAVRDAAGLVGIAIHWSHQSLAATELAAEVKRTAPGAFVDPAGQEWGLELSSEVARALDLCDGARSWPAVASAFAAGGATDPDALLAELYAYGAIG